MNKLFVFLLLSFSFSNLIFSQSDDFSPLREKLLFSLNGGVAIPKTDFKDLKPGFFGLSSIDYYFNLPSRHALGLRIDGGVGNLKGKDERHFPEEYSDNIFFLGGGAVYSYAITKQFLPYLFLGVANLWIDPKDNDGTSIMAGTSSGSGNSSQLNYNWELGLKIMLNDRFALNISGGEYLSAGDNLDGIDAGKHNDVFLYGAVGLSVTFLGESDSDGDGVMDSKDACPGTPPGIKVDLMGCPLDSDNDGIPDYKDQCSDTPAGVKVDDQGCPLDSDKDGVPDYMDNCPHTPAKVSVDKFGCAKDSDNDGVPDYKDNCPGTPFNVKVDANGCPEDLNKNGIPDYLEVKEPALEIEVDKPVYDVENEHNAGNMIFTDGNLYTAQISAWKTKIKAESQAEKFRKKAYNAFVTEKYIPESGRTWYRVRIGYFETYKEAENVALKLRDKNIPVGY